MSKTKKVVAKKVAPKRPAPKKAEAKKRVKLSKKVVLIFKAKKVAPKRPAPKKAEAKKRVKLSLKALYGHMGEFVKTNAAKLNNHAAVAELNVRIALVTEYLKFVQENS